jgi:hypothetical protein
MIIFRFKLVFWAVLLLTACGQRDDVYDPEVETAKLRAEMSDDFDTPRLPPTLEGWPMTVQSDPGASFRLLRVKRMVNHHVEALTRRDGPSGTYFSRREIDCLGLRYRGLGEGETRAKALIDSPNLGELAELMPPSIAAETAAAACMQIHQ